MFRCLDPQPHQPWEPGQPITGVSVLTMAVGLGSAPGLSPADSPLLAAACLTAGPRRGRIAGPELVTLPGAHPMSVGSQSTATLAGSAMGPGSLPRLTRASFYEQLRTVFPEGFPLCGQRASCCPGASFCSEGSDTRGRPGGLGRLLGL